MADNTLIYNIEYPEGDYAIVTHSNDTYIKFHSFDVCDSKLTVASFTREEAIAAAKAILKHFDQDWNAYEENISERYRAPTAEEMAKFLADNPNYKPIPQEAYDPDAPLTSELAKHFGEE